MVYPRIFSSGDFEVQSDGCYMASISATEHNLGTDYRVTKMLRRNSDLEWENQLGVYKIKSNGAKTTERR